MLNPELEIHAEKIKRLLNMDRDQVVREKLNALVKAIENGEMTVREVLQFTNITEEQLKDLMNKGGENTVCKI